MSGPANAAGLRTANENVIRALARVLAEARAGNVAAVAIITASPDCEPESSYAGQMELIPIVNTAVDMLKVKLIHTVMKAEDTPVTTLVRPAGGLNG